MYPKAISTRKTSRLIKSSSLLLILVAMAFLISGSTACANKKPEKLTVKKGRVEKGQASWYGKKFHGKKTASGERFNMYGYTAAHKTLPFGTKVRVTNLDNGKKVVVRINDRGPFVKGRVIDLSYAAAKKIGMLKKGVVPVKVEVVSER